MATVLVFTIDVLKSSFRPRALDNKPRRLVFGIYNCGKRNGPKQKTTSAKPMDKAIQAVYLKGLGRKHGNAKI